MDKRTISEATDHTALEQVQMIANYRATGSICYLNAFYKANVKYIKYIQFKIEKKFPNLPNETKKDLFQVGSEALMHLARKTLDPKKVKGEKAETLAALKFKTISGKMMSFLIKGAKTSSEDFVDRYSFHLDYMTPSSDRPLKRFFVRDVLEKCDTLTRSERTVIDSFFNKEKKLCEIAAENGVTSEMIRLRKISALKKLRIFIEKDEKRLTSPLFKARV